MKEYSGSRLWLGAFAAIGVLGAVLVWWATRASVGLEEDAAFYFSAARSFGKSGQFLMPNGSPMVTWPPGYSLALAAVSPVAGDVASAARWLDVFLFPFNAWLVGALIWRTTRHPALACMGVLLFVLSPLELGIYVSSYAEPLCLAFWLLSLHALLQHLASGGWWFLLGSALAAGLAAICRYPGIVMAVAGVLFLLVCGGVNLTQRLRQAAIYGVVSAAPFALQIWRYLGGGIQVPASPYGWYGTTMRRTFAWYGLNIAWIKANLFASVRWLVPFQGYNVVKYVLLFLLVMAALALWRAGQGGPSPPKPESGRPLLGRAVVILSALNLLGFTALYYLTVTFLDPFQEGGARMVSLSFVFVLLPATVWCWSRWQSRPPAGESPMRHAAWMLPLLMVAIYIFSALQWLRSSDDSLGLATKAWRKSEGLAVLATIPPERPIYSKWSQAIYLYTGRAAREVPMISGVLGKKNPNFAQEMSSLVMEMAKNDGVLVVFKVEASRVPPMEWLRGDSDLRIWRETADAIFFEAVPPKSN